jgi:hypothetical protein
MPDPIKDVTQAVGNLGMAEPMVWIGRKLAEGGAAIERGVEAVKRAVSGPPAKPSVYRRDMRLPKQGSVRSGRRSGRAIRGRR